MITINKTSATVKLKTGQNKKDYLFGIAPNDDIRNVIIWQNSATFLGLADGNYTAFAKKKGNPQIVIYSKFPFTISCGQPQICTFGQYTWSTPNVQICTFGQYTWEAEGITIINQPSDILTT
jgi:hypothetical protein